MNYSRPKISVVVATHYRPEALRACLDCLSPEEQSVGGDFEVIVSDDSNDHDTHELIYEYFPWVKWFGGRDVGASANRNNGAQHARGDWWVFLDDDCLPDRCLVEAYLNAALGGQDNCVWQGEVVFAGRASHDDRGALEEGPESRLRASNFMIKSGLFRDVGGFDRNLVVSPWDEWDLAIRLGQKGAEIVDLPEAITVHPGGAPRYPDAERAYLQACRYFRRKHGKSLPYLRFHARRASRMFFVNGLGALWRLRMRAAARWAVLAGMEVCLGFNNRFRTEKAS